MGMARKRAARALLVTGAALQVAPNILSIAHGDRLLGGALYTQRAAFPR